MTFCIPVIHSVPLIYVGFIETTIWGKNKCVIHFYPLNTVILKLFHIPNWHVKAHMPLTHFNNNNNNNNNNIIIIIIISNCLANRRRKYSNNTAQQHRTKSTLWSLWLPCMTLEHSLQPTGICQLCAGFEEPGEKFSEQSRELTQTQPTYGIRGPFLKSPGTLRAIFGCHNSLCNSRTESI